MSVPTKEEIMKWIEDMFSFGPRIPGSEGDRKTEEYIKERLKEFGIEDVRSDPIDLMLWEARRWSLEVRTESGASFSVPCFYMPYTRPTGKEGVEAEIVYVGEGRKKDFRGVDVEDKIVMADVRFLFLVPSAIAPLAYFVNDPEGTLTPESGHPAVWIITNPSITEVDYSALIPEPYVNARDGGAVGFIGVLMDYPEFEGEEFSYYAPYDGSFKRLPGMWIPRDAGDRIKEELKKGRVFTKMVLEADVRSSVGHNIYGVLPGKSDDIILVHSHHDGPFGSAVEDASGCALVLALAKYFASIPENKREKTMIFLFTEGHFYGGIGQKKFIEMHKEDLFPKIVVDIAIEHIAKEYLVKEGKAVPTGRVEPRGMFISDVPALVSLFKEAVQKYNIKRILLLPTNTPLGVPTDAGDFWRAGLTISSLISGPLYLFHKCDTPDKVADEELVPLTKMYIDVIEKIHKMPSEELRGRK